MKERHKKTWSFADLEDEWWADYLGETDKPSKKRLTFEKPRPRYLTSRQRWDRDFSSEQLRKNETDVRRCLDSTDLAKASGAGNLLGLAEPGKASAERLLFYDQARAGHRRFRAGSKRKRKKSYRFSVTVIISHYIVPEDDLADLSILSVRRRILALDRKLKAKHQTTGVIEVSANIDRESDSRTWVPHGHLTIDIRAESRAKAKKLINAAYESPRARRGDVLRPLYIRSTSSLDGWLRYASKGLQLHGVGQRVARRDIAGSRIEPARRPLTNRQQTEYVALLAELNPKLLTIIGGHHRHGDSFRRLRKRHPKPYSRR